MSNLNNDSNTLDTAESRPRRITAALYSIDSIRKVDEHKYTKLVNSKNIPLASFPTFSDGTSLTLDYVKTSGLKFPIIIESPENLGMKMPDASLTVHQVSDLCGPSTILDVLEVSTQSERQMKLKEWADYFSLREEERDRILNVITLEIGDTDLGRLCKRPNVVNQIDWIDTVWPKELKESMEYPRVQLYCLMSVKDSYTEYVYLETKRSDLC